MEENEKESHNNSYLYYPAEKMAIAETKLSKLKPQKVAFICTDPNKRVSLTYKKQ